MRVTAGILMILVGLTSFATLYSLVDIFGETTSIVFVFLCFLSLGLTWGGGICAFTKKAYWWALFGAICSVIVAFTFTITSLSTFPVPLRSGASVVGATTLGIIFVLMGILAVIFLTKRRGEFQE